MSDLSNVDDIISQTVETLEDEISEEFCTCFHLISEHFIGKCYALEFNGTVWGSCNCKRITPYEFKIKFYESNENLTTESA